MSLIKIIDYEPAYQQHFEQLNKEWIEKYFWLEEIDKYVLENPQLAIIDEGGTILMALFENEVAGTVALKKVSTDVYEFTKMAVSPAFRRKGIAEALSYAAFEKAFELGAKKVILYSNSVLVPAISMYKKIGFEEVALEKGIYKRSDIKMEIELGKLKQIV